MLPEKTTERLSQYRRLLQNLVDDGKEYVFSHDIALLLHLTPVQVRRDIMLIGYSGSQRKGYSIQELIGKISQILDSKECLNAAIFGVGNLGKAITSYFNGKGHNIKVIAAFDDDMQKSGRIVSGVWCYEISQIKEIVKEQNISLAVLTLPPHSAQDITDKLVYAGIRGILNFTSVPLRVSPDIFVENYDMITSLEKLAYYVKEMNN